MSKYEARAAEIKAKAKDLGLFVSWAMRKSGLFLTLSSADGAQCSFAKMSAFVRQFYPNADLTSGGYTSATFKVMKIEKPPVNPVMPLNNSVQLGFHWQTSEKDKASVRANALFIQSKLVSAGLSPTEAKDAVERLFNDGWREGHEDGYGAGYEQGRPDEFDK